MSPKHTSDWRDALSALAPSAPEASRPETDVQRPSPAEAKSAGTLTLFYERKGRGGKQATIIAGFTCTDSELKEVASALKQRLATGGSARGGEILIQGDRRAEAAAALRSMGYKVKNG